MACIDYPLCKYAHYEDGALVCETGAPCGFQRYCSTLLKVIHTSAYKTCKEAKKMSNNRKTTRIKREYNTNSVPEIEEKQEIPERKNEIIEKKELCKARYDNGLIYISFKGYGLVATNDAKHNEPELMVYYSGDIGKPNFRFRV